MERIVNGYKSNSIRAFCSRVMDLTDGTALESTPDGVSIPHGLQKALDKKKAELAGEAAPPPAKRKRAEGPSQCSVAADHMDTHGGRAGALALMNTTAVETLAELFRVDPERIRNVRHVDHLFSLVDFATIITGKSNDYAGQQIRILVSKHGDLRDKITKKKFAGRGTPTYVGSLYVAIELVLLLPGTCAGRLRAEAARLLVQCFGGDLRLADAVIENRQKQEELRVEQPSHPARMLGEQVERERGYADIQKSELEQRLQALTKRSQQCKDAYDPARLKAADHNHKDNMLDVWLRGIAQMHGEEWPTLPFYIVALDDFGQAGEPRVACGLEQAGFPLRRYVSPNRNQEVVDALRAKGVRTAKDDFSAFISMEMDGELRNVPIMGAYVDSCTGDVEALKNMLDAVIDRINGSPVAIAYTIVERSFTAGGARPFVLRVLQMSDFMRGEGFEPQHGSLSQSYKEAPNRPQGKRVGTAFWIRKGRARWQDRRLALMDTLT